MDYPFIWWIRNPRFKSQTKATVNTSLAKLSWHTPCSPLLICRQIIWIILWYFNICQRYCLCCLDMAEQIEIITRSKWGALAPKEEPIFLEHPLEYIWLRESPLTMPCLTKDACMKAVRDIQKRDMAYFNDIQAK